MKLEKLYNIDKETIDYSKQLQSNLYVCNIKMDKNYKFINKNIFYRAFSWVLYIIALIVLWPITLVVYGLKVKGKKNLKGVKNGIFVCNHILEMDFICIMCHLIFTKKPYILSLTDTFRVPGIRRIVKLLGAVPLPVNTESSKTFMKQIDEMLEKGGSLIVFAEGSMWPYYNDIRPFKDGAFKFSYKSNVPVVPLCTTLRKPNKFYRMFGRKKPLATINILSPIYPNKDLNKKQSEIKLKEETFNSIKTCFDELSVDTGYISPSVKKYFEELSKKESL